MSERSPCVKCGRLLHTGEARVLVSFSADELARLARDTTDVSVWNRIVCALGLVDPEREQELRAEPDPNAQHDFVGDEIDCALCGEGWCHYVHDEHRSRVADDRG